MTGENTETHDGIEVLFHNFKEFLKEKNRRYGDSALHPAMIFSDTPADTQICNRLDDKLNRIRIEDYDDIDPDASPEHPDAPEPPTPLEE
jgi:hypothetical protein